MYIILLLNQEKKKLISFNILICLPYNFILFTIYYVLTKLGKSISYHAFPLHFIFILIACVKLILITLMQI